MPFLIDWAENKLNTNYNYSPLAVYAKKENESSSLRIHIMINVCQCLAFIQQ